MSCFESPMNGPYDTIGSPCGCKSGSCGISIRKGRTNTHLACPFHYQSDDYREESESTQRCSIDCQEPQNLALLSPHASHPFSGVLPRKIQ
jgi:hypothetical protein